MFNLFLYNSTKMFIWVQIRYILVHRITLTMFLFRKIRSGFRCDLELLSWKRTRQPITSSNGSILIFSIEQYISKFMMPSIKFSSSTPAALTQTHIRALYTFFLFLTLVTPDSVEKRKLF